MKSTKLMLLALPALVLAGVSEASARDIYCDMKGGGSTDRVRDWFVVNSKARTPQMPGQTKPTTSCSITFNSVGGMHRPIEIITRPKLGEAKTSYGTLYYRSAKNGEDFLAIRMHEVTRTGGLQTLIFKYRIIVTDRPL